MENSYSSEGNRILEGTSSIKKLCANCFWMESDKFGPLCHYTDRHNEEEAVRLTAHCAYDYSCKFWRFEPNKYGKD
ncbi:hypothetical protein JOC77_003246 [Peribacillus deserti]|uniref:Uncharacterized protein n=1 Tax=Peribacillus deserti TaxID=673318 RepID=A0ABS2QKV0_9BACI|nr:hypothetical protein [Peribacillus deserti]